MYRRFQVEMGTGENISLPSDWENEPADDREEHVQTEELETNEFPFQWEFSGGNGYR